MGPPIYIGGNGGVHPRPIKEKQLQWGHRFISVETPITAQPLLLLWSSFNGATDLYRWKHVQEEEITYLRKSFNGATDLYRWKLRARQALQAQMEASMGPPIYIGGNVNVRVGTCGIVRLQWGHRFISVETTYVLV